MKILVTGGAGYVGQPLVHKLIKEGYQVTAVDNLVYNQNISFDKKYFVKGDIRDRRLMESLIKNCDCVLHLAAVVGEAAYDTNKKISDDINILATQNIADLCKQYGKKMVFASSCSVYGAGTGILTEDSKLVPLSAYAQSKLDAENYILGRADEKFKPVILRFGTVYGLSQRMRFDLVVNIFIAKALTDGTITVHGGDQWRPFVHVGDVINSYIQAIKYNKSGIFNIGGHNYTIIKLAKEISEQLNCKIEIIPQMVDKRDYNVSSEKAEKELHVRFVHTIKDAIVEIRPFFKDKNIDIKDKQYTNSSIVLS